MLSIVIPAFNEEESIQTIYPTVSEIVGKLAIQYEIIFVNDGSSDRTEAILETLCQADSQVRAVNLSRNFGKEAALAAGLEASIGDSVVILDADMQHPPSLIPAMIEAWRQGFDVVNAVKRKRSSESLIYRLLAGTFNKVMSAGVGSDMSGASDFKLLDREVVDAIIACPERNRFFRGLVAWIGFNVKEIEFDVAERTAGETRWSSWRLLRYSITSILVFSSMPLRAVAYIGFLTVLLGFILMLQTLARYFMGHAADGFTTVITVQILLSGMILLSVGVVAIYVSYIYDEQKKRPIYLARIGSTGRRSAACSSQAAIAPSNPLSMRSR